MDPTKKYINIIYPFINVILIPADILLNAIIMFDNNPLLLAITILNITIKFTLLSIILYNAFIHKKSKRGYLIVNTLTIMYHIINLILIVVFYNLNFIVSLPDPRAYVVIYASLHIYMIIFSINSIMMPYCYESKGYDEEDNINNINNNVSQPALSA